MTKSAPSNQCLRSSIDIMFCVPEQHRRVIPAVGCAVDVRLGHGPMFLSLRIERESLEILLKFVLLDFESSLCGEFVDNAMIQDA